MTTSVKVEAHCSSEKEVHVTITDDSKEGQSRVVLQDGENTEQVVYDGRKITVKEVEKAEQVVDKEVEKAKK